MVTKQELNRWAREREIVEYGIKRGWLKKPDIETADRVFPVGYENTAKGKARAFIQKLTGTFMAKDVTTSVEGISSKMVSELLSEMRDDGLVNVIEKTRTGYVYVKAI